MADSEVDTTQQATSKTPSTIPKLKNPKRVEAGKRTAEKTKQAREAQKKALAEARVIIANNQMKTGPPAVAAPEPPAVAMPEPPADEPTKITTTQWLSVISIIVSLVGIYYKREEIKGLLTPKKPQVPPPSPALPRAPPPSPVLTRACTARIKREMD